MPLPRRPHGHALEAPHHILMLELSAGVLSSRNLRLEVALHQGQPEDGAGIPEYREIHWQHSIADSARRQLEAQGRRPLEGRGDAAPGPSFIRSEELLLAVDDHLGSVGAAKAKGLHIFILPLAVGRIAEMILPAQRIPVS